tara:strand:- start:6097 stop:6942 length:846 start_codon:yes stop_codon:yes gene_type:complete
VPRIGALPVCARTYLRTVAMAPKEKVSLVDQKKKLKEKEQRAKDNEKREKATERGDRKAQEQKDKMFGLKNKATGKAAGEALSDAERTLKSLPGEQQKAEAKARENAKRKELEMKAQVELNALIRDGIKQPKVPEGVDPKTLACEHFKNNVCDKGARCVFSHDFTHTAADKTTQLMTPGDATGTTTKSGAKSKAQLDKETTDAAKAVTKEKKDAEKLAETMKKGLCCAFPKSRHTVYGPSESALLVTFTSTRGGYERVTHALFGPITLDCFLVRITKYTRT